jgi:hypothetical protein
VEEVKGNRQLRCPSASPVPSAAATGVSSGQQLPVYYDTSGPVVGFPIALEYDCDWTTAVDSRDAVCGTLPRPPEPSEPVGSGAGVPDEYDRSGEESASGQVSARTRRHKRKAELKQERRLLLRQQQDCDHEKMERMAKNIRCVECKQRQLVAVGKGAHAQICKRCDEFSGAGIACSRASCRHFTCLTCRLDEYKVNVAFWIRMAGE